MAMEIKLITGVCGSGKTRGYMKYISKYCHEKRFIVAVPTIEMAQELFNRLESEYGVQGVDKLLSTDGVIVNQELTKRLHPSSKSRVLLVTHKAMENLGRQGLIDKYLQKYLEAFTVILDESPAAVIFTKVNVAAAKHHKWLDYVSAMPLRNNEKGEFLVAGNAIELRSFYREPQAGDSESRLSVWAVLAGFPLIKVPKKGKGEEITGCVPNPIFQVVKFCAEFFFVSANAENSPLVVVAREILKIPAVNAPKLLQPEASRNKHFDHVVTCYPLLEKRASLTRLSSGDLYKRVLQKVLILVEDKFIYATNSDKIVGNAYYRFSTEARVRFSKIGTDAGYISHGINLYGGSESHGLDEEELLDRGIDDVKIYMEGYANAVWLGVSRLSNEAKMQLAEVCSYFGGNGDLLIEAIENFMSFEAAYQLGLRTRLRNPKNREPIKLVVIDAPTAEYIVNNYIPNAKIIRDYIPEKLSKAEERRLKAIELHQDGRTVMEIMGILGVGKSSVYEYLAGVGGGRRGLRLNNVV